MDGAVARNSLIKALGHVPEANHSEIEIRRRAVVFLLFYFDPQPTILAIQKTDSKDYPWRNQVALPGGHIDESDQSPLHAAFREVLEEVNITQENIEFISSFGHFPTIKGVDIEVMAGVWNHQGDLKHDPSEIARIIHMPWAELKKLHDHNGYRGIVPDVFQLKYTLQDPGGEYTVWGVTARILHHLMEELPPHL